MAHIQLIIHTDDNEKMEILIAMLSEQGFTGFEQTDQALHAFIEEHNYNSQILNDLKEIIDFKFDINKLEMRNWNSDWESNFNPVQVLNSEGKIFAHIRAPFHEICQEAQFDLLIQPKMSFGTGHHATTAMMVGGMAELPFSGKSVIDFGTGTGILAVLAEKLGAASILAIDCDDWSIENARENLSMNDCHQVEVVKAEQFPQNVKADIILANINLNVILDNVKNLMEALAPGGYILFSGIMHQDEDRMRVELKQYGIDNVIVRRMGDWSMLKLADTEN